MLAFFAFFALFFSSPDQLKYSVFMELYLINIFGNFMVETEFSHLPKNKMKN